MVNATMYGIPVHYDAANGSVKATRKFMGPLLLLCIYTHIFMNQMCGTDYPFPIRVKK